MENTKMKNTKMENVKLSDIDTKQVTVEEFKNFMSSVMKEYPAFFDLALRKIYNDTISIDSIEDNDIDIKKISTSCNEPGQGKEIFEDVPYLIEVFTEPNPISNPYSVEKHWCIVYSEEDEYTFETYEEACKFIENNLIQKFSLSEIRIIKEYPFNVKVIN